jgi:hypothetical protein
MTNPVPEMADCVQCKHFKLLNGREPYCFHFEDFGCINASGFKPAEPIRLYTITSEGKI